MTKLYLLPAILGLTLIACNLQKAPTPNATTMVSKEKLIERGAYLITLGGCDDCHSPKKMGPQGPELDMDLRLSGFPASRPIPAFDSNMVKKGLTQFNEDLTAAAGPWGITFAANLTSDQTGAGSWPLENFKYSLRHGKIKGLEGSRPILPPMPWINYSKLTDEDLEAMHAFLQNTKPVQNIVPAPKSFNELK